MKIIIYPYKISSKSAKHLSENLFTKRVRSDGRYMPKRSHLVVNWGSSVSPNWRQVAMRRNVRILNTPESVALASNKLSTFYKLCEKGVNIPDFTSHHNVAQAWSTCGYRTISRQVLNGHSGRGIVVNEPNSDVAHAPLYTVYVKKQNEYRVHVFMGKVIDYAEKKHKQGLEPENKYIRNHNFGWVFCRDGVALPDNVKIECLKAVNALGLDFGAVDIVLSRDGKAIVLEVNTAAGLEGTTLERYVSALKQLQWSGM